MNNELTLNELSNKVVSLEKQLEELKKVEIQGTSLVMKRR